MKRGEVGQGRSRERGEGGKGKGGKGKGGSVP